MHTCRLCLHHHHLPFSCPCLYVCMDVCMYVCKHVYMYAQYIESQNKHANHCHTGTHRKRERGRASEGSAEQDPKTLTHSSTPCRCFRPALHEQPGGNARTFADNTHKHTPQHTHEHRPHRNTGLPRLQGFRPYLSGWREEAERAMAREDLFWPAHTPDFTTSSSARSILAPPLGAPPSTSFTFMIPSGFTAS
jgi:hypothetical protein